MNLVIVFAALIMILFVLFMTWYKLRDWEEGELIYVGFGTYVEEDVFEFRLLIALVICFVALLVGLGF